MKVANQPAIIGVRMHVTAAEPFLPDILSEALESLAIELPLAAGQFSGRLAPQVRLAVGELVRSMNCYYSNLIDLISHAMLKELGIGSTLWSVSRGLARSVADYKASLMAADEPRQGDFDGRGNLSRKNLIAFCEYFLVQCLDQVRFMERLLAPTSLGDRIQHQVLEAERMGALASGAHRLMRAALDYGEVPRGDVPAIVQASERTGQRITKSLVENGYLHSERHTDVLVFAIPAAARDRWFPSLYPHLPPAAE